MTQILGHYHKLLRPPGVVLSRCGQKPATEAAFSYIPEAGVLLLSETATEARFANWSTEDDTLWPITSRGGWSRKPAFADAHGTPGQVVGLPPRLLANPGASALSDHQAVTTPGRHAHDESTTLSTPAAVVTRLRAGDGHDDGNNHVCLR